MTAEALAQDFTGAPVRPCLPLGFKWVNPKVNPRSNHDRTGEFAIRRPSERESRVRIGGSADNPQLVDSSALEILLHFLRSQVVAQRGAARLERGAVQLAVQREHDGSTEYWTLLVTPNDVSLERGALPLEHPEPIVTLFTTDVDLLRVSRGEAPEALEADGDPKLLQQITACFKPSTNLIGARRT